MASFEEIIGDQIITLDQFVEELEQDRSTWAPGHLPDTLTLRRWFVSMDWASINKERWKTWRMRYTLGLSIQEIAVLRGISESTVKRHLQPVYLGKITDMINK